MNKLVVLGGAFNPLTLAHLEILNEASKLIDSSIKILLPANISFMHSWKKFSDDEILSQDLRLKILDKLSKENNFIVEKCELEQITNKTYESLNYLKNKYSANEIYFVCGVEKLSELNTWYRYKDLLQEFKFIVFKRNNLDPISEFNKETYLHEYRNSFYFLTPSINIEDFSSTKVRKALREKRYDLVLKYCGKEITEILLKGENENEI